MEEYKYQVDTLNGKCSFCSRFETLILEQIRDRIHKSICNRDPKTVKKNVNVI